MRSKRVLYLTVVLALLASCSDANDLDGALSSAKADGRIVMLELGSAVGHCALIFVAGFSIGLTENIVSSRGVRNFSAYAKKLSGGLLALAGLYVGIAYW